jgi:uncharacterized RDD family membrane protein YckC
MRILDSAPAGRLARRLGAYLIDCLLLFAGVLATQGLIVAAGLNPLAARAAAGLPVDGFALNLWVLLTVTGPCLLYFAAWHAGPRAATPGKRWLGLRVTDASGRRIGRWRALGRATITLLPFEWNHLVLFYLLPQGSEPTPLAWAGIGLTWALVLGYALCAVVDGAQRSPADWAAGTRVIDR